jgi:beta-lactamase class A
LNNTVTAYDLMLLFEQIGKGKMVSKKASDSMIAILQQQELDGVISAKLPADVRVAHKTGSIEGVLNDSGIVYLPDGHKYVVVLLSANAKATDAKATLSAISQHVYNYLAKK